MKGRKETTNGRTKKKLTVLIAVLAATEVPK